MSFAPKSPKDIPDLLREAYRIARERRDESSRILRKVVLTLSPLLVLVFVLLLAVAFFPSHAEHPPLQSPHYSVTMILVIAGIVIIALAYIVWMVYYFSRCFEEAMKLAIATVDRDESIRDVRCGWAMVRLGLLLTIPMGIAQALLRSAGLGSWEERAVVEVIFSILFLSFPAVIESGSAVEALQKGWLLMGTHTLFLFYCGLIATIPSIVTPLLRNLLIPSTGRTIVVFVSLIFTLWFDFQYAPFFIALIYRTVSPKEDTAIDPGTAPETVTQLG